jgi:hypothetical protein
VASVAGYLKRAIDGEKEVSQLVSGNEGERLVSNQGVSADDFVDKGVVLRRDPMVEGERKAPRLITNRDAISDTSEGKRLVSIDGGIIRDDYQDKGVIMKGERTVEGVEKDVPPVSDGGARSGALEWKRFLSVRAQEIPSEKLREEGVVMTGHGTARGEKNSTEPVGNARSWDEVEQRFSDRGVYLEKLHEKGVITNGTTMTGPGKGAPENVGSFVLAREQVFSNRPDFRVSKSGQGEGRRVEESPLEEEITYQA